MKREHSDIELPSGYGMLEYLHLNGTNVIDTGIKANNDTKVQIKDTWDRGDDCPLFGVRTSENTYGFLCWENINVYSNGGLLFYNGNTTEIIRYNYPDSNTRKRPHDIVLDRNGLVFDGVSHSATGAPRYQVTQNYNLILFGLSNSGSIDSRKFIGDVYYARVWQNGTELTREYIPALREADNKTGFYETVNNTFIAY